MPVAVSDSPLAQKLASDLTTTELLDLLRTRVNVTVKAPAKPKPQMSLDSLGGLDKLSEEELHALVSSDPELKSLLLGVSSDYISPDLINLSREKDSTSQSLLLLRQQQLNDKLDLMQQQLNLKNSLENKLQTKQSDSLVLNSLLVDYQSRLETLTNDYKAKLQNLQNQSLALTPQIQQDPRLRQILGTLATNSRQPATRGFDYFVSGESQRPADDFDPHRRQES